MSKQHQSGFGLVNLMVAILLFSFGLLALAGAYARMTMVVSQNENVTQMSSWSNAVWGVVQANPAILVNLTASRVTYTSANYTTAPAPLRPLLAQMLVNNGALASNAPSALSNALAGTTTITFEASADAAAGGKSAGACGATAATILAATTTCTLNMEIAWEQAKNENSTGSVTRTQYFTYQFGF